MAKRKSIHIPGMEHGAPIPNGVVIGNMVFSSAIGGKDAKTGVMSDDPDEQAEAMFLVIYDFSWKRSAARRQHRVHESLFERKDTATTQRPLGENVSRRPRPSGPPRATSRPARQEFVSNRSDSGALARALRAPFQRFQPFQMFQSSKTRESETHWNEWNCWNELGTKWQIEESDSQPRTTPRC